MSTIPGSQRIEVPKWMIYLRGAQLLLAIIILGLSAYGLSWLSYSAWGVALFSALFTTGIAIYHILITLVPSTAKGYNWIALLVLDSLAVVFWLSSMADLAATRAAYSGTYYYSSGCYDIYGGYCYRKRGYSYDNKTFLGAMSAAAGLSAILLILFIVTLVFLGINVHRQRTRTAGPITNDKVEAHPMANSTHAQAPQEHYYPEHYTEAHQEQYSPPQAQQYPPQSQVQTHL